MAAKKMMAADPDFKVKRRSGSLVDVYLSTGARPSGWEQWFLLSSDRHHDNPHSRHDLMKEHLDEVVSRRAGVIDNGDMLCLMQGKYDKRHSKGSVRPEHYGDNYFDLVLKDAAEFYSPYAKNIVTIGEGNHETAISKRLEWNITDRLVEKINTLGPGPPCAGHAGECE